MGEVEENTDTKTSKEKIRWMFELGKEENACLNGLVIRWLYRHGKDFLPVLKSGSPSNLSFFKAY
jgi:hypothetical protein